MDTNIKTLSIQAIGESIDVVDPGMEWNQFCTQLPRCGDYGT